MAGSVPLVSRRPGFLGFGTMDVLISSRPLENWGDELGLLRGRGVDKQFLRRTGRVLLNHFKHGMEVPLTPLEEAARSVAGRFELPLEVRNGSAT